jgi:F-type H+-transporting ATPase subunit epsilon
VPVEVHLVTPEREIWYGPVQMVVARGIEGEVGILGGHAPMLVQLAIGPLRMQLEDGTWLTAVVDGGFLHISSRGDESRADVLANSGELASEIDLPAAQERVAELEELLRRGTALAETEIAAAVADLQKARVRVDLAG